MASYTFENDNDLINFVADCSQIQKIVKDGNANCLMWGQNTITEIQLNLPYVFKPAYDLFAKLLSTEYQRDKNKRLIISKVDIIKRDDKLYASIIIDDGIGG